MNNINFPSFWMLLHSKIFLFSECLFYSFKKFSAKNQFIYDNQLMPIVFLKYYILTNYIPLEKKNVFNNFELRASIRFGVVSGGSNNFFLVQKYTKLQTNFRFNFSRNMIEKDSFFISFKIQFDATQTTSCC